MNESGTWAAHLSAPRVGGYTHGAEQLDAVSTEHSAHPPTDTREPDTACGIEPSHPRNAPGNASRGLLTKCHPSVKGLEWK